MGVSQSLLRIAFMATAIDYFNTLEGNLCLRVNRLSRNPWVQQFFSAISKLGDGWFWGATGILTILVHGIDVMPKVLTVGATAIAGVAIYKGLKQNLVRERPYINHRGIHCGTAPLDRYSFPSGHTLHAVCFTVMFNAIEPLFLAVTLPFAILVAASRIILGLHYPSDVVVGAAIGGLLGSGATLLL